MASSRPGSRLVLMTAIGSLPIALVAISVLSAQQVRSLEDSGTSNTRGGEEVKLFVELGSKDMSGGIAFSPDGDLIPHQLQREGRLEARR